MSADPRPPDEPRADRSTPEHAEQAQLAHPVRIGGYSILEVLGEGGMGTVYLAEQNEPIRRRVAIKAIKPGMDTREVVARFDAERQALALLHHPNVAQVFDAGATAEGRPYFVMEYVPGASIVEFCDASEMGVAARLALFEQVCRGMHHAHERGIVHRDLKPSNILIQAQDGDDNDEVIPKIIDFGVAKATNRRLTDKTLLTEHGQIIGTPEYMSPEQVEHGSAAVDPRSDIYSLGVLLYELLVGALPFDPGQLRSAGYGEIQRQICEVEPQTPSKRLTTSLQLGEASARKRRTTVASLLRELRGNLDWIVMKALQKDPARRYQTARALADDVGRHLRGDAVQAGPPSLGYRMRRAWHRHGGRVTAVAIVAALITVAALYVGAEQQNAALRDQLDKLQNETESATAALPVTDGTVDVAAQNRPGAPADRDLIKSALPDLQQIVRIREAASGPLSADTAQSLRRLAQAKLAVEDHSGALPLFQRCVDIRRQTLGDDSPATARALNDLAACQQSMGRYNDAIGTYEMALSILERTLEGDQPLVATTLSNLAVAQAAQGQIEAARQGLERALSMRRRLYPDDHPAVQNARHLLAQVRVQSADASGAFALIGESVRANTNTFDAGKLLDTSTIAARTLRAAGDLDGALEIQLQVLENELRVRSDRHPRLLHIKLDLAQTLFEKREFATAAEFQRQVLDARRDAESPDLLAVVDARNRLASTLLELGEAARAAQLHQQVIDDLTGAVPDDHPQLLAARAGLAETLARDGELERAVALMLDVYGARFGQLDESAPLLEHPREFVRGHLRRLAATAPEAAARLRGRLQDIER